MAGPIRSPSWRARLRRLLDTVDRWPGWLMVLIAVICTAIALWLLIANHDITLASRAALGRYARA